MSPTAEPIRSQDLGSMRNALGILSPDLRRFRPKRLMAITGLGQTELSKVTGKARPLLYEKELPLKISSTFAKAIFSLVIVTDLAFELFGADENETKKWLMSPNTLLFGDSPFFVCLRGESTELMNWLNTRLGRKPGVAF
jgi:hypothetical protein